MPPPRSRTRKPPSASTARRAESVGPGRQTPAFSSRHNEALLSFDVVNLLRLAIVTTGQPWLPEGKFAGFSYDRVEITASQINVEEPGSHALLTAGIKIRRPRINQKGEVVVPRATRRLLEGAIEGVADLAAISTRSSRTLSSLHPSIALDNLTEDDRRYLSRAANFARPGLRGRSRMHEKIEMTNAALLGLIIDRPDGVALLAEALSAGSITGQFHEYLRLFERAFKRGPDALTPPLAKFLRGARALGYAKNEVQNWLLLRGPATHADRRPTFVLSSDIAPIIWRVEQAAYDVIFNKKNWRAPDTARRDTYRWDTGSNRKGLFSTQGRKPTLTSELHDMFGSYPHQMSSLRTVPDDWWIGQLSREDPMTVPPDQSAPSQESKG